MHIPAWNVIFPNGCVPLLFGSRTPDFGLSLFSCTFRLGTSWFFAFRNSGSGFPTVVDVRPMFSRALFSITSPVAPAFLKSGSYKTGVRSQKLRALPAMPCPVPRVPGFHQFFVFIHISGCTCILVRHDVRLSLVRRPRRSSFFAPGPHSESFRPPCRACLASSWPCLARLRLRDPSPAPGTEDPIMA